MKLKDRFTSKLEEIFGIDLRALAVFRILLGLIIIYDLINRLPDVGAFYTDSGVYPRQTLFQFGNMLTPSLYLMAGDKLAVLCLFFLAMGFAAGILTLRGLK